MLDIGDVKPITVNVRDSTGAAIAAGAVVVTLTDPAGVVTTPAVTNPALGTYVANFTAVLPGIHSWRATAAVGGSLTTAQTTSDVFYVSAFASGVPMVGLMEAKAHLRISSIASDEKLRQEIMTACRLVEGAASRIWTRRTVVESYLGGKSAIRLRTYPAISITSVVDDGVTLTGWTLTPGGVLWYGLPGQDDHFYGRFIGPVVVTYLAGQADGVIPETIRTACLEQVRHQWEVQSGGKGSLNQGDLDPNTAQQWSMPWRVRQMIEATDDLGVNL